MSALADPEWYATHAISMTEFTRKINAIRLRSLLNDSETSKSEHEDIKACIQILEDLNK